MIEWEEYKEECCVVVPVYKENPSFFEQAALIQCIKVLGKKHDICLVAPYGLDLTGYTLLWPEYKLKVKRLVKDFFKDIKGYNHLCKRWEFYNAFAEYRYILIYQLDCWVFDDRLDYFIGLDYDYIGAPWLEIDTRVNTVKVVRCGNGGFSLRKVSKFIEVCRAHESESEDTTVPEDVFFSTKCPGEVKVSPIEVGYDFSFEVGPSLLFKLNGNKLPMGCHKPYLFEYKRFWKNYIKF